MKKINVVALLFLLSAPSIGHSEEFTPIKASTVSGSWECSFTMQGDKVYKENWTLKENDSFSLSGTVEYFLEGKNANYKYAANGKWDLVNETIKLVYEPFEFESIDSYSEKYKSDIEKVYITPAWNGSRRFQYYVEKLSPTNMQIGDDYDSWQCSRK